jgi:hypothetical protein
MYSTSSLLLFSFFSFRVLGGYVVSYSDLRMCVIIHHKFDLCILRCLFNHSSLFRPLIIWLVLQTSAPLSPLSFWSFLQSHPFVVISWTEKPQDHLDLFIEPRRGLTRELLYHAKNGHAINPLVLLSGPYGKSIPIDNCENILMVASDFGIAAHLPYLKQLIHGYNAREVRARRIHLVWQVRDIGKSWPLSPPLEQRSDRARRHNRGPAAP